MNHRKRSANRYCALVGSRTLSLLLVAELEMLASLDYALLLNFADCTFQAKHDFLSGLSLFVEYRLCLSSETSLLHVIASLPLRVEGVLPFLVLGYLVECMFPALLRRAVSLS